MPHWALRNGRELMDDFPDEKTKESNLSHVVCDHKRMELMSHVALWEILLHHVWAEGTSDCMAIPVLPTAPPKE
jgi:hypothetical protein